MPGKFCSIFGCTNRYIKGGRVTFHRFPKDPGVRSHWIRASRRRDWIPPRFSSVCSEHFIRDDFKIKTTKGQKKRFLKAGAIPSFKKWPENEQISYTKSDSLIPKADPTLKKSGNQGPMKLQCLECQETFDLEYNSSKKLHKLKPNSVLCSHVKRGGKTATVPSTQIHPESKVLTETSKSDSEPNHDSKQDPILAHEKSPHLKAPNVQKGEWDSKAQNQTGNVQRIFDMNSLCFFDSSLEINRHQGE